METIASRQGDCEDMAALLASLLDGTPRPVQDDLVRLLSPERYER